MRCRKRRCSADECRPGFRDDALAADLRKFALLEAVSALCVEMKRENRYVRPIAKATEFRIVA
jgi:hypothetical protein